MVTVGVFLSEYGYACITEGHFNLFSPCEEWMHANRNVRKIW